MIITVSSLQVGQPMLMRPAQPQPVYPTATATKVGPDGKAKPIQMSSMPPVGESPVTGAAKPRPGQQANPIQMHGIYTNNPGFVEMMNKAPWENPYAKASPPATTPAKPAAVNTQLNRASLPYGKIDKKGFRYDNTSELLPSPVPSTPDFGSSSV